MCFFCHTKEALQKDTKIELIEGVVKLQYICDTCINTSKEHGPGTVGFMKSRFEIIANKMKELEDEASRMNSLHELRHSAADSRIQELLIEAQAVNTYNVTSTEQRVFKTITPILG